MQRWRPEFELIDKFRQLVPLLTNKDVSSEMTYIVLSGALNSTPTNQL